MKQLIVFLILSSTIATAQTRQLSGKVLDSQSQLPLAFVSIAIEGTPQGTVSDIDGKFSLKINSNGFLLVSYVGYESKKIAISSIQKNNITILLSPKNNELAEVLIRPEEDPAYRIIRLAVLNKPRNDPEQLEAFQYNAYTIAGLSSTQTNVKPPDPEKLKKRAEKRKERIEKEQKKEKVRTVEQKTEDSVMVNVARQLLKNYILVTESYTLREFTKPNLSKEKVLATRLSGFTKSPMAMVASNFQPFGFYRDFIPMMDKIYESPLTKSAISQYEFELADTLSHETDSTFVILFEPKKGKNFEGLKGVLYINSDGYAVENVIAQPAETANRKLNFKLQQKYQKSAGHWFPQQLNTEIVISGTRKDLETKAIDSTASQWTTRSYIYNIDFEKRPSKASFADISQEITDDARIKPEEYWTRIRQDSLQTKEQQTYEAWEKMPEKVKRKINSTSNFLLDLAVTQAIPLNKNLEIPLKYVLNSVNQYEKTRLGFGLRTTPQFSNWLTLEGNVGYGFGDNAWKYGGNMQFNFDKLQHNYLKFSYLQDLAEPGTNTNFQQIFSNLLAAPIRKFISYRMDSVSRWAIDLGLRPFRKTQLRFWLLNEIRNPAKYDYIFQNEASTTSRSYQNTEVGLTIRLASEERYNRVGRYEFANIPPRRLLLLQLSKGLKNMFGGQFDYTKIDFQYTQLLRLHGLGQTTYQLNAGQVLGAVPYSYLFNGMGSGGGKNQLWVQNSFQTMGLYEFMSDRYANVFLAHNFGKLLYRSTFKYSQPEVSIHQGIGYGSLSNASAHQKIDFKTLEKGYFESGLYVNNIVRIPYANVMYLGVGAGVFYRYGNNAFAETKENFALRWGLVASF